MAALNDVTRTRIGKPWRGTFYISTAVSDVQEAQSFAEVLDGLGVTFQANFRRDERGRPLKASLAIYDLDSQRRLLAALGDELDEPRREALDTLVRARGPVPKEVRDRIRASVEWGRSYEQIAQRMTELKVIDGSRAGWTKKKVRAIDREKTA